MGSFCLEAAEIYTPGAVEAEARPAGDEAEREDDDTR